MTETTIDRADGYPSLRTASITLALLILTMTLGYIDRQVIVFVVDPIRASFSLTDAQMGLVQGFSATLFMAVMSMPFGWAVDRWNRRNILVVCMLAWAVMTVATGLSRSYEAFFMTRIGLGIAKAWLYPAPVSVLAGLFPPPPPPTANLFLIGGANVSIMVAYMLCGTLVEQSPAIIAQLAFLPAGFEPWRMAFVLVALPVPLVAALLMLMPEPSRQGRADTGAVVPQESNFARYAWGNRRVIMLYPIALALCVVGLDATLQWLPTALSRNFSLHAGEIGVKIGFAAAAGALLAPFVANLLFKRFKRRGSRMPELAIMVLAASLAVLPAATFALAYDALHVVAAFAVLGLLVCVVTSYNFYVLQRIAPGRLRGQMTAFALVVRALITGGGVWLIGYLSDHRFTGEAGLLSSMTLVGVGSLLCAAMLLLYLRRNYLPLVDRIEREEATSTTSRTEGSPA